MRLLLPLFCTALVVVSCGQADPKAASAGPAPGVPSSLLLHAEDLLTVQASQLAGGPVITGSIQPARRADLRAEVPAVVMQVLRDNGDPVRSGELLMRLDDTALRDNLSSAEEAARAAGEAVAQSERQVSRLTTLKNQGMVSAAALEDAEIRRTGAKSDHAAAAARVVGARQQMQRTLVRAPFDGLVSERKVSVGDTVQIGRELVKVIDPGSMRFEGLVSADRVHEIAIGQQVRFDVNGYPDAHFEGTVRRIDVTANATTRQLALMVAFDDPAKAPVVSGLFAEGQVDTGGAQTLSVPDRALVRSPEAVHVWRAAEDKKLGKVVVRLGQRDARSGDWPVHEGLVAGDRILRNPGSSLIDGQAFELVAVKAAASAAK